MSAGSERLRGALVGAGYFSQFHLDAWRRVPEAELVAICDSTVSRAHEAAAAIGVSNVYADAAEMLAAERLDFLDIATPPASHATLCELAGRAGVHVLCQKPLAPTFDEAARLVGQAEAAGIRLMVHDNFRFQPWHRELRALLDDGAVGRLHSVECRTRLGDGWGADAYLARQPYFRTMPQLLVFETGVHFIDVFRYLGGEIRQVFAKLRRLNAAILGEDCGLLVCDFENGAVGLWDANRFNESLARDPRYTFGEFLVEGDKGSLRLDENGRILVHPLGQAPREHVYAHEPRGFAGDSCYAAIRHFVDALRTGSPFETSGRDYLRTLAVQEAVYASAAQNRPVDVVAP
jgi:predicted dehydrogenase